MKRIIVSDEVFAKFSSVIDADIKRGKEVLASNEEERSQTSSLAEVAEAIRRLIDDGDSADELEGIKARMDAEYKRAQDNNLGQLQLLLDIRKALRQAEDPTNKPLNLNETLRRFGNYVLQNAKLREINNGLDDDYVDRWLAGQQPKSGRTMTASEN